MTKFFLNFSKDNLLSVKICLDLLLQKSILHKKIFCFLLIFIIMPILYSQKVNVSIDEFTDKKIIYKTWKTLSINIA